MNDVPSVRYGHGMLPDRPQQKCAECGSWSYLAAARTMIGTPGLCFRCEGLDFDDDLDEVDDFNYPPYNPEVFKGKAQPVSPQRNHVQKMVEDLNVYNSPERYNG